MKFSENQKKVLVYVNEHPEGSTTEDMKHLFEGDITKARGVGYQLWKKGMIKKKVKRRKQKWDGVGEPMVKYVIYYPLKGSDSE